MRIAIVTEWGGLPDEGAKNWSRHAALVLAAAGHEVSTLELAGPVRLAALHPRAWLALRRARPDAVLYVPYSLLTRNALVRLRLLGALVPRATRAIAVLQSVKERLGVVPGPLRADLAAFASQRLHDAYPHAARRAVVVPPLVDLDRYRPDGRDPADLRAELGLGGTRPLLLHVGHLRRARNLQLLGRLARSGDWDVVMVASPRFAPEDGVVEELERAGVAVVRRYVPDLERWYRAADVYVFPVDDVRGAIELPLTVLEALASGTPVVTTPFGGLAEFLPPADWLVYARPEQFGDAVARALAAPRGISRSALEPFGPERFARTLTEALA